jgi:protein-S-isoprenylcysteine O-methyltransferase Ste14
MAILPGISLFVGMPLLLLIPVIVGLTFRFMMMKSEEEPLCKIFGEEYLKYCAEVNAMLPTISRLRK